MLDIEDDVLHAAHALAENRGATVGQVLSGRLEEARLSVRRLRELEPELTVRVFRERYPGRESPQAERFATALRAAGLPE